MSDNEAKPHPLAATTKPSDEAARRALELHHATGELLKLLAPLDNSKRTRVLAAVICSDSDVLSQMVIDAYTQGVR